VSPALHEWSRGPIGTGCRGISGWAPAGRATS